MQRQRLFWVSVHPNHYHSYLLENLQKVAAFDLFPIYLNAKISKYPWATNFIENKRTYIVNEKFGADWVLLCKIVFTRRSLTVIAGWNYRTTFLLATILAVLRRRLILFSDTPNVTLERKGLLQLMRKKWLSFIFRRMELYLVTGVVGVEALKVMHVPEQKIINFPFATDTDFFVPVAEGRSNTSIVYFSSGRLDLKHKGYDKAIQALGEMKLLQPELDFHYFIAGTGPDTERIVAQIEYFGLSSYVTLLGWLEPDRLLEYYQSCDFFVHPSNFDPYPNAVLEAMSCGLPVIGSTLAGSVVDRVRHGVTGYIFNAGDLNDLKRCLRASLETDEEQRRVMKSNCRSVALQWSVNYHVKLFKDLFRATM